MFLANCVDLPVHPLFSDLFRICKKHPGMGMGIGEGVVSNA
jgi:hypothetical protein